jgi:hypothetical protein
MWDLLIETMVRVLYPVLLRLCPYSDSDRWFPRPDDQILDIGQKKARSSTLLAEEASYG